MMARVLLLIRTRIRLTCFDSPVHKGQEVPIANSCWYATPSQTFRVGCVQRVQLKSKRVYSKRNWFKGLSGQGKILAHGTGRVILPTAWCSSRSPWANLETIVALWSMLSKVLPGSELVRMKNYMIWFWEAEHDFRTGFNKLVFTDNWNVACHSSLNETRCH